MRSTKSLFAVAVASMLAIAAFSAATASAGTVLCTKPVTNCAEADVLPAGSYVTTGTDHVHFVIEESEGAKFVDCGQNIMSAKTTAKVGTPLPATFAGYLNPSKCHGWEALSSTCTSASMNTPPVGLVAGTWGAGTIEIGSASQPLTVTLKCNYGIFGEYTCVYTAANAVKMAFNGSIGVISNAPMSTTSSGFCGAYAPLVLNVENLANTGKDFISNYTGP